MRWKRPDNVPVGKVWSRFQGKARNGSPGLMYQIRDMDESYRTICLDLMTKTFLRDEPICKALDNTNDPESIEAIRKNWNEIMDQKLSIACFTEENGEPKELVGLNILMVKCTDDDKENVEKVKGKVWRQVLKTLIVAESLVDVFSLYGVDTYLSSSGLVVIPGHRGQNIGVRFLEARKNICEEFGIKVTCTVFTAITSQVLATKCGYEVLAELPYSEMIMYGIDLSGSDCPSAKVMGIKYC
ncbi:uncharacterized protein LOC123668244 [Melitaea cinxia]|uniref:uncharacterized protein LOC123668244 n=1 Tax=Melitaea cinxia TaxID=113334 RepID=UPI001E271DE0|nr:uncharacterized protein LOC123668244 [Melitaea cinxia]